MAFIKPQHINAVTEDMKGNQGIGRYVFLTGSDERAKQISSHFQHVKIKKHPRQHHLYLGTLPVGKKEIDVAAISTGMGGSSADLIINELIFLGAKRFLRIGTAASLQAPKVNVGELVIATAAVRDDKASWDYIYPEYPAIASFEYLNAIHKTLEQSSTLSLKTHFGIVHSKSSLYAREFQLSLTTEGLNYMKSMVLSGVLATEMECAQLFILSSIQSERFKETSSFSPPILCAAILAIIGDNQQPFTDKHQEIEKAITGAIHLGIQSTIELYLMENK